MSKKDDVDEYLRLFEGTDVDPSFFEASKRGDKEQRDMQYGKNIRTKDEVHRHFRPSQKWPRSKFYAGLCATLIIFSAIGYCIYRAVPVVREYADYFLEAVNIRDTMIDDIIKDKTIE